MRLLLLSTLLLMCSAPAWGTTWFVRPGGGTRYSTSVTAGQCNGQADADYPGTGTDQPCAYNDIRYLWSDNSGSNPAWVIAGGDTVVIRGCHALAGQTNPSNPNCRLGYDNALNGNPPNQWCGSGNGNTGCFNPPIPAGTSGAHTKILGGCAYGTYTCTPINNNYPYGATNETQLFGGFGLVFTFNLQSTQHVDIQGIELTTHNGVCTYQTGSPAYPRGCSNSPPYDDYAVTGFIFNNQSADINLQDVYVHGFTASGLFGPIGGTINLTRVFSGFNAFAGWNFDDANLFNNNSTQYSIDSSNNVTIIAPAGTPNPTNGLNPGMIVTLSAFGTSTFLNGQVISITSVTSTQFTGPLQTPHAAVGLTTESGHWINNSTPDYPGSSINAQYVTQIFNGCYEQYPITNTYPAQVCYDTNSAGFGDSWSGQNTPLVSFTCNYCVDDYNTKDGFIGPHVETANITITNSVAIGNMGSNWKWGGDDSVVNTTLFENNLTVNNCSRMSASITGAPSTYNQYLTGFCRAGGNGMASVIPTGSTWNLINNTFITAQQIAIFVACNGADSTCPSTINSTNNVFLGYVDPNNPYGGTNVPTVYDFTNGPGTGPSGITLNVSHNDEFGMRSGTCPSTTNGTICVSPLLLNQPSQTWVSEAALDVFNPLVARNSFYPTSGSPLLASDTTGGPSTDYYMVTRPVPGAIGAVEYLAPPAFIGSQFSSGSAFSKGTSF